MALALASGILDLETEKIDSRRGTPMNVSLTVLAGFTSTVIFAVSALPMLIKAYRTKDLSSYSGGNILLANGGNLVYSVYVYALPPGPIWLLHTFYLLSTALMLVWYLRYEWRPRLAGTRQPSRLAELPPSNTPSGGSSRPVHAVA
jgi:uncharacterized protein with PQ loop repeat